MKVIFLDIDGVLNSGDYMWNTHMLRRLQSNNRNIEYCARNAGLQTTRDEFGHIFDPRCVICLAAIIEATGAKIVITSTWRRAGLERMQELWKFRNLPGEVVGVTPSEIDGFFATYRYDEIREYIKHHSEVEQYVIIDDDTIYAEDEYVENFIKTTNQFGLDYFKVKNAIEILNS